MVKSHRDTDEINREWKEMIAKGKEDKEERARRGKPDLDELIKRKDVDGLIGLLKDDDSSFRWQAAFTLGEIKDKGAVESLINASKIDKSWQVKWRAAEALGKFGDFQHLERLLRDEMEQVRIEAAKALVNIGGLGVVPILIGALKDTREDVYQVAAWGLSFPLMQRRDIEKEKLNQALAPAIQHLVGMIEGANILEGSESFNVKIGQAIQTIGIIGDSSAIPSLQNLLAKVKGKVKAEGMVRKYVNTGIASGYISPQNDISRIESAIAGIREREK